VFPGTVLGVYQPKVDIAIRVSVCVSVLVFVWSSFSPISHKISKLPTEFTTEQGNDGKAMMAIYFMYSVSLLSYTAVLIKVLETRYKVTKC